MKFTSNISTVKCKYITAPPCYIFTISETDLVFDNAIFSLVCFTRLESCASTAM